MTSSKLLGMFGCYVFCFTTRLIVIIIIIILPAFCTGGVFNAKSSSFCPVSCECRLLNRSASSAEAASSIVGMKCAGLAENGLLHENTFANVSRKDTVEELDLSGNKIIRVRPNVFEGFTNLRSLNLSGNKLATLKSEWFDGIGGSLERLYLADNPLEFIPERSLERLNSMKYIDLSTLYLTCDCKMKWFRRWIGNVKKRGGGGQAGGSGGKRSTKVTLSKTTICQFPAKLRGIPFAEVLRKRLVCGGRLTPAAFVLHPKTGRVFAPGSSVSLKCNVSTMSDDETLEWLKDGRLAVVEQSDDNKYEIETMFEDAGRFHITVLKIKGFQESDVGKWTCRLETAKGSLEFSTKIFLLRNLSQIACPLDTTVDQKGRFTWPDTLLLSKAELPCPRLVVESELVVEPENASRACGEDGQWSEPITDHCSSNSLSSMFDEQLAVSLGKYNSWDGKIPPPSELLREVSNLTEVLVGSSSPTADQVNLLLQWVERVAPLAARGQDEGFIFDIANNLLKISPRILRVANQSFRTATRILNILRSSSTPVARSEFAVKEYAVGKNDEAGVAVTFVEHSDTLADVENEMKCWRRTALHEWNELEKATVALEIVFDFGMELKTSAEVPVQLRYILYKRASALAQLTQGENDTSWTIEQPAIGVISNRFMDVADFVNNVSLGYIILRWKIVLRRGMGADDFAVAALNDDTTSGPFYWTPSNSCTLLETTGRAITFTCPMALGFYTLMRRLDDQRTGSKRGAVGRGVSLAPWVMVASGVCISCLLSACIVHCVFRRRIRSSVKLRHALINSWLAMAIQLLVFTLGLDLVSLETLCLAVALLLHYSTLAVLLWILLVVRTLQRKLRKTLYPKKLGGGDSDDEDDAIGTFSDPRTNPRPRHGPLVGMYFLAWGLPAMPCAFTLPLRINTYTSREESCFVDTSVMSLIAFGIPASIVIVATSALLANGFRLRRLLDNNERNKMTPADYSLSAIDAPTSRARDGAGIRAPDAISCASTDIGDVEDGGAKKHLTAATIIFSLTLLSYTLGASMAMRIWVILDFDYLENYFLWALNAAYAAVSLVLAALVSWCYVLGRRALRGKTPLPPAPLSADKKNPIATGRGDEEKRKVCRAAAAARRRSRPPTTAGSLVAPFDVYSNYKDGHLITTNSPLDPAGDASRCNSKRGAGAVGSRAASELSGTVAPSRTNVSNSKSCKAQQAVARKYYEKQRLLKMNTSSAGANNEGDVDDASGNGDKDLLNSTVGKRTAGRVGGDVSFTTSAVDESFSKPSMAEVDASAEDHVKMPSPCRPRNGLYCLKDASAAERKPSVELYRKPVGGVVSKAPVVTSSNDHGLASCSVPRHESSGEDSSPEALRGDYIDNDDALSGKGEPTDVLLEAKTETSV